MGDNNKQAPSCMDIQTLSFAGAGLVASLTLLAVQLVLQVALCRTDPAPLIVCTLLVFIFVKALGLFGSSGGIMDRIARGIMAAGAAMLTPEAPARPSAPPPAQPKKDDKKSGEDKQEDKKNGDNKNANNKNGDNKNGDNKKNGGDKKDEKKDEGEKKDGKKEEKSCDDEVTKIVKKYLEQLKVSELVQEQALRCLRAERVLSLFASLYSIASSLRLPRQPQRPPLLQRSQRKRRQRRRSPRKKSQRRSALNGRHLVSLMLAGKMASEESRPGSAKIQSECLLRTRDRLLATTNLNTESLPVLSSCWYCDCGNGK